MELFQYRDDSLTNASAADTGVRTRLSPLQYSVNFQEKSMAVSPVQSTASFSQPPVAEASTRPAATAAPAPGSTVVKPMHHRTASNVISQYAASKEKKALVQTESSKPSTVEMQALIAEASSKFKTEDQAKLMTQVESVLLTRGTAERKKFKELIEQKKSFIADLIDNPSLDIQDKGFADLIDKVTREIADLPAKKSGKEAALEVLANLKPGCFPSARDLEETDSAAPAARLNQRVLEKLTDMSTADGAEMARLMFKRSEYHDRMDRIGKLDDQLDSMAKAGNPGMSSVDLLAKRTEILTSKLDEHKDVQAQFAKLKADILPSQVDMDAQWDKIETSERAKFPPGSLEGAALAKFEANVVKARTAYMELVGDWENQFQVLGEIAAQEFQRNLCVIHEHEIQMGDQGMRKERLPEGNAHAKTLGFQTDSAISLPLDNVLEQDGGKGKDAQQKPKLALQHNGIEGNTGDINIFHTLTFLGDSKTVEFRGGIGTTEALRAVMQYEQAGEFWIYRPKPVQYPGNLAESKSSLASTEAAQGADDDDRETVRPLRDTVDIALARSSALVMTMYADVDKETGKTAVKYSKTDLGMSMDASGKFLQTTERSLADQRKLAANPLLMLNMQDVDSVVVELAIAAGHENIPNKNDPAQLADWNALRAIYHGQATTIADDRWSENADYRKFKDKDRAAGHSCSTGMHQAELTTFLQVAVQTAILSDAEKWVREGKTPAEVSKKVDNKYGPTADGEMSLATEKAMKRAQRSATGLYDMKPAASPRTFEHFHKANSTFVGVRKVTPEQVIKAEMSYDAITGEPKMERPNVDVADMHPMGATVGR
jgi:hypothetical protein